MHYASPRAYEFLRETFGNHLPNQGTIKSWLVNSDLNTEPNVINEQCLNILRRKVSEKAEKGEKLMCGLIFDEMSIRKHIQWTNKDRKLVGYSRAKNGDLKASNQALVFIVNAVNDSFQLPISYYIINSADGDYKKSLVEKIIEALMDCGIVVTNVTFDGALSNKRMCRLLGAVLNVYSPMFKPHILVRGHKIHIFFDICHVIKLIRTRLATDKELVDSDGNKICWKYFVELVQMQNRGFTLTHKMNQSHIDWKRKKMKVDLAVQTLSKSTADSMEFLMNKGVAEFAGAGPTIKFVRTFDTLFNIFNTKHNEHEDAFKRALSFENKTAVFAFFDQAIIYIRGLKIVNDKGKLIKVCNSRINTGFSGSVINMMSLKELFHEYVELQQLTNMFRTYCFQQDPVEIFFG